MRILGGILWVLVFIPFGHAATLVHTNDVLGDIEPCGCRTNPLGGMARKYHLLKKMKDPLKLQLDTGDLLFPSERIPNYLKDQSILQAKYLLKSMDLTHHQAAVPGEKDFALGLKIFENLRKSSQVQFLAANLKRRDGKSFLNSHAIFTEKDPKTHKVFRIGVVGLVGEKLQWPHDLKVSPGIPVAQKEVISLQGKVDLLIFLTHQGLEEDRNLARRVSGIDLIVGGHSQAFLQNPEKVKKTWLVQSSFRNQYVGTWPLSSHLDSARYELVGLDTTYDSPVNAPSEIDDWVKEFKTRVAELNSEKETSLEMFETGKDVPKYQTFPKCLGCHLKQFDFWRNTLHAHALEPLFKKNQHQNKECLTCHTLGLGDPEGWGQVNAVAESYIGKDSVTRSISSEELRQTLADLSEGTGATQQKKLLPLARSWAPVQCENCHQPGRDHPFSGEKYLKTVEIQTCLNCHNLERSPSWYTPEKKPDRKVIEVKKSQVTCPAGESE